MAGETTITREQVEKMQKALHEVYEERYKEPESDDDELRRGYGMALDQVLDLIGVEHEKWDPCGFMKYED